jgi:phosphate transport system substrate-binding protein
MPHFRFIVCALMLAAPAFTQTENGVARKLYVEPLVTKAGSEKLHEDLIAELRKLASVSLVPDESSADVILGGGGEIWVKGYQSLNPRSGRMPSNGKPLYAGYLSVELRDPKGDTLWSDLVTPGAGSPDVSKELAKRIAGHVAHAFVGHALEIRGTTQQSEESAATITLQGAGATFPYPVYSKWFTNYRRRNPNLEIRYQAIGSEAGVRKLLNGDVDFGASDNPDAVSQLAPADEAKYLLFPSVVGAVVPIVNLPGIGAEIRFTPEALAGIYLGRITKWNDPVLRRANPHVRLPDLDIVVIHRSDGSGTSYAWTDYLSQTNTDWKAQIGSRLQPHWPVGKGAAGNDGVAGQVKERGGSIGYVEFIYALQNHLSYGKVRNQNGEFVSASLEGIEIAAKKAMEISDSLKVSLVNAPGAGAYPIASFTWLIVPQQIPDALKRKAVIGFLRWMLDQGQVQAAALGYLGLPKDVVVREEEAIRRIH